MFDDPDLPIRLAAFRAVKALTERFGDAVPWEALARGFEHQGRQIALASRPRGIFRPKEMRGGGALSVKTTVPRTGRQARYADLVDPRVGQMDYCFQGEDPDSRDNQLLDWCYKRQAPLLYLYATDEGVYAPIWPVFVGEFDRARLRARLVHDDPSTVPLDGGLVLRDPGMVPLARRYHTVQVRARLHQAAFSALVLRAYGQRCAVCELPRLTPQLVEAAHIVPDRDEQGLPEVPNGLALCVLHHRAFDSHLMGVRPDAVIVLSERVRTVADGPVLEVGLKGFAGQKIRLPTRAADQPGPDYLEERWESFRQAG